MWCCCNETSKLERTKSEKRLVGISNETVPGPSSPFPSQLSFHSFRASYLEKLEQSGKENENGSEVPNKQKDKEKEKDKESVNLSPLDYLRTKSFSHLPLWSLAGTKTYGKITKILDGDLFEIVLFVREEVQKHILRLVWLQIPKEPNIQKRNKHEAQIQGEGRIKKLVEARKAIVCYLSEILREVENMVWIEILGQDKYGSWLGEIFLEKKQIEEKTEKIEKSQISINKQLILNSFAKPYNGKQKEKTNWSNEELEQIITFHKSRK
jgi:hypothetical protein